MIFKYLTPFIYWLLIIIWAYIFIFYTNKLKHTAKYDKLLRVLLIILAIDAFRSLFESVYFGAWYTSIAGILPIEIYNYLKQPQIVFFPKLTNLIAALLILFILIKKWLPSDIAQKNSVNKLVEEQLIELKERNEEIFAQNEEYKQINSELYEVNEKIKEREKSLQETNASLKDMVYIASHDLQVPLVSMEGYASELLENNKDKLDEEGIYCLTRLEANAKRMHKLVLSLLDISRLNTHKHDFEHFDLSIVMNSIIKDIALTIEDRKVRISALKLPTVFGDKQRIEGVFRNLIINSISYGGKEIEIGFESNLLYVKDDGIGIAPDHLDKIFVSGERLKVSKAEGVGMGLTFCKKVIELHNGKIWAESEGEGKGTTIKISLN